MTAVLKQEPRAVEKRRHQRVKVALLGRYMLSDRHEYPCQSIDISPGGAAMLAPVLGEVNERVVCYFDHIGRLEGTIARRFENGFALTMTVPLIKREKLADQLTWLANRHSLGMPEDRRHERIVPRNSRTTFITADGVERAARIQDVSQSGVAVITDARPTLGAGVTVGRTPGRVVRLFGNGIGIEFSRVFPADQFGADIVL